MFVLVTYDVKTDTRAGRRRLRQVAVTCEDFGLRVQDSVFECLFDPGEFAELRQRLLDIIEREEDRLTFYHVGNNWRERIERHGVEPKMKHGDLKLI